MTQRHTCPACRCNLADPEEVIARLCDAHGVDVKLMRSELRTRRLMQVRRHVARELRSMGLTMGEIARLIGRKEHSTVVYLLRGVR